MPRHRAFTGFGDSAPEPTPHDVAMIGTQVARADGTQLGIHQLAHQSLHEAMAAPAAVADTLAETIGESVDNGLGEAGNLAAATVNKAQGAFLKSVIGPTESAIRLGWVPQGAPGTGAGGRSGRRGGRSPRPAQPADPTGDPPDPPPGAGGAVSPPHQLSAPSPPPTPAGFRGATGGAVPPVAGAGAGPSAVSAVAGAQPPAITGPANLAGRLPAPGGPLAPSGAGGASSPALTAPASLAPPPAADASQQLFGLGMRSGAPPPGGAAGQAQQPPAVPSSWIVLADCAVGNWTVLDQSDPAFQTTIQYGQFVPLRRGFGSDFSAAVLWARAAHGVVPGGSVPLAGPAPATVACVAYHSDGAGWPANGDFGAAGLDNASFGEPVGPWPFDQAGNYTGG